MQLGITTQLSRIANACRSRCSSPSGLKSVLEYSPPNSIGQVLIRLENRQLLLAGWMLDLAAVGQFTAPF
jgi:hypothetical protein